MNRPGRVQRRIEKITGIWWGPISSGWGGRGPEPRFFFVARPADSEWAAIEGRVFGRGFYIHWGASVTPTPGARVDRVMARVPLRPVRVGAVAGIDCACETPKPNGAGECSTCALFACEYADRGQTRCDTWLCDCFIEEFPDSPRALHPEAFVVAVPAGATCGACGGDQDVCGHSQPGPF